MTAPRGYDYRLTGASTASLCKSVEFGIRIKGRNEVIIFNADQDLIPLAQRTVVGSVAQSAASIERIVADARQTRRDRDTGKGLAIPKCIRANFLDGKPLVGFGNDDFRIGARANARNDVVGSVGA